MPGKRKLMMNLINNSNMIKRLVMSVSAILLFLAGASCKANTNTNTETVNKDMSKKILFINGSPNKEGNTANMTKLLLSGHEYETLNLCDYRINFYGQTLEGDQFDEILEKMKTADIVVFGSPVYWHNICASVRTFLERFYGYVPEDTFKGKHLFFIYQGAAPTQVMIDAGEYTMKRFADIYGFVYEGMATSSREAEALNEKVK